MLSSIKELASVFGNAQNITPLNVSPNSFDIWYLNEFPREFIGKTEIRYQDKFLCSIRKNNNFCQKCSAKGHTILFCPFQNQEIPQETKKAIEEEKITFGRNNNRKGNNRFHSTNPKARSNSRENENSHEQANFTDKNNVTSSSSSNSAQSVPTNTAKKPSNQTRIEQFAKNVNIDISSTPHNSKFKRFREKGNLSPEGRSPPNKFQAFTETTKEGTSPNSANVKPVKIATTTSSSPIITATPTLIVTSVSSTPEMPATSSSTNTVTPTSTISATPTPAITETPTPIITATPTSTITATPTPTFTATPTPTITETPSTTTNPKKNPRKPKIFKGKDNDKEEVSDYYTAETQSPKNQNPKSNRPVANRNIEFIN